MSRKPHLLPCAERANASVTESTLDMVSRYGYVARAYAQGRLSECLYQCDEEGTAHWQAVSNKLDLLAIRAPDLLSIVAYLNNTDGAEARPQISEPQGHLEPRVA